MEIKKFYRFSQIQNDWKKLYESNPELSPYQSDWYAEIAASYYLSYSAKWQAVPLFLEVIDNEAPVMIVPLCKKLLKDEYTMFGDEAGYGYIDFIYSKDIGQDKIEECFELLCRELKGNKLSINCIREESLVCQFLLKKFEPKPTICTCADLHNSYEEYLASLNKHDRHHIRNAYSRLESENKKVSLKVYYKQQLPPEELSKIVEMYAARRKSRYGRAGGTLNKLFFRYLSICSVAMKKTDKFVHFILYIDDSPAAFYNGFLPREGGAITIPRLAINIEYGKYSPGILLLNESIKKILELGIADKIDFMKGQERYKYEMGGKEHLYYGFDIFL